MTTKTQAGSEAKSSPEEVSVTVRLPKALHRKMSQIATNENKSLSAKIAQAVREHAALYERSSVTVTAYARRKTANEKK